MCQDDGCELQEQSADGHTPHDAGHRGHKAELDTLLDTLLYIEDDKAISGLSAWSLCVTPLQNSSLVASSSSSSFVVAHRLGFGCRSDSGVDGAPLVCSYTARLIAETLLRLSMRRAMGIRGRCMPEAMLRLSMSPLAC